MPEGAPLALTGSPQRALARPGTAPAAARPVARLELRRNRLLYASWPGVFALTTAMATGLTSMSGLAAAQGFGAGLFFWTFLGLPITAVLFGATAGAGLRGPSAETEAALPVSPRARVMGTLAGSAAGFALVAAVVVGVALAASADLRHLVGAGLGAKDWGREVEDYFFKTAALGTGTVTLYLLLAAFGLAYATGQAVLGGALAALAALVTFAPLAGGMALHILYGGPARFGVQAGTCAALSLAGAAGFLAAEAPRLERAVGRSLARRAGVFALLLAGAGAGWPAFTLTHARLAAAALPAPTRAAYWWTWLEEAPLGVDSPSSGFLAAGYDGGLRRVQASGRRVALIAGSAPSLRELLTRPPEPAVREARADGDGRLWALRAVDGATEVWQGLGDAPLHRHLVVEGRPSLASRGRTVGLLEGGGDNARWAELSAGRRGVLWTAVTGGWEEARSFLGQGAVLDGLAAWVEEPDLVAGTLPGSARRRWRLPGRVTSSYPSSAAPPLVHWGGRPAFAAWVEDPGPSWPDGKALVLCRADGTVETAWRGRVSTPRPVRRAPDGTFWTFLPDGLLAATPDGGVLTARLDGRRLGDASLEYHGELVRAAGGRVWLAAPGRLWRVDAETGAVTTLVRLGPGGEAGRDAAVRPTRDGVFFAEDGRLVFADWDGNKKDLGRL